MGDGYVNPNNRIVNRPEKPRKKTKSELKYERWFQEGLAEIRKKKKK